MLHRAARSTTLLVLAALAGTVQGCGSGGGGGAAGSASTARAIGATGNPPTATLTATNAADTRELLQKLARGDKTFNDLSAEQKQLVLAAVALERERKAARR
ncbi:MAG: hypothetical protein ACT4PL_09160 [Phycisphaerales bacterium]